MVRLVVMLGLLVCLPGSSMAQDNLQLLGRIGSRDNSVTKVMLRAGCSLAWLSQVAVDSKIDPSTFKNLRDGRRVYLRGSCKTKPSAKIASLSAEMMRRDRGGRADAALAVKKLQAELASLRDSSTASSKRLEALAVEAGNLRFQVASLQKELEKAKRAEREANSEPRRKVEVSSPPRLWQFVAGLMFVAFLCVGYLARKWYLTATAMAKNVQFPHEVVVEHWSKEYVAPLRRKPEAKQIGYECPFCKQWIFHSHGVMKHIRENHRDEGKYSWEQKSA